MKTVQRVRMTTPYTLYAVALLYFDDPNTGQRLGNYIFSVSGNNPLTEAEAVARARVAFEAKNADTMGNWRFVMATPSWCVLETTP